MNTILLLTCLVGTCYSFGQWPIPPCKNYTISSALSLDACWKRPFVLRGVDFHTNTTIVKKFNYKFAVSYYDLLDRCVSIDPIHHICDLERGRPPCTYITHLKEKPSVDICYDEYYEVINGRFDEQLWYIPPPDLIQLYGILRDYVVAYKLDLLGEL